MAIIKETIQQMSLTPGEAAAIALFDEVYNTRPDAVKKLLEDHDQVFTGDPNMDFMQVYELSKTRERFFNEDYTKMCEDAKYFNLGDVMDKVKGAASKVVEFVKPVAGAGLQVFAPAVGMLAESKQEGTGALAQGLSTSLGAMLSSSPKPTNPNATTLKDTFGTKQTDPNLDNRPGAADILKNMLDPTEKKILGMKPMWFYVSLAGLIIVIIIIVILAVRAAKKKKLEAAKKS